MSKKFYPTEGIVDILPAMLTFLMFILKVTDKDAAAIQDALQRGRNFCGKFVVAVKGLIS